MPNFLRGWRLLSGRGLVVFLIVILFLSLTANPRAGAQSVPAVTSAIDDANLVTLPGNTYPLARPEFDQGIAASSLPLERMLLVLKRSPEREAALRQLLAAQQDKDSMQFHRWLTPGQIGERFGPAAEDIEKITAWLRTHGFAVAGASKSRNLIEFSGTHAQMREAFHTEIHQYLVNGESHVANTTNPKIPAALAPVVAGIASLNNFPKRPTSHLVRHQGEVAPDYTDWQGNHYMSPGDFWSIYNVTPAIQSGTTGAGVTIGIVGRSDVTPAAVDYFRSSFLPGYTGAVRQINNGPDPGVTGDVVENTLDVEWSGAIAPDAAIDLVISASTITTDGVDLSAQYLIDNNIADVISVSYGECELFLGQAENDFFLSLWEQAAAQGITVVVASGDSGSASCDAGGSQANYGLQVSGLASGPYNVALGGSEFYNDGSLWNVANGIEPLPDTSALGYMPEEAWNESCSATVCGATNANLWAGGGGASGCVDGSIAESGEITCSGGWPKPSWQSGVYGIPNDGARDLPDLSFSAAGHDGYLIYYQPYYEESYNMLVPVGGTSASAPSFAGVMALVNQKTGDRQGQAGNVLYQLGRNEYGSPSLRNSANLAACNSASLPPSGNSCVFYDVTVGSNAVPCTGGSPQCSAATTGDIGRLTGYAATPGYDLATGLGSVNVSNLLQAWSSISSVRTPTTTEFSLSPVTGIIHGSPVSVSIRVTPAGGSGTPSGTVEIIAKNVTVATVTLTGGSYTGAVINLPGGNYTVQARYAGDGTYKGSISAGINVSVGPESSVTVLSLHDYWTGNPFPPGATIPYGSQVIADAKVTGLSGTGVATGLVTLWDGSTTWGQLPLDSSSTARWQWGTLTGMGVGQHALTASYAGDASLFPNSSSPPLAVTIVKADTRVAVVFSGSPPVVTAIVSSGSFNDPNNGFGFPPTGNVNFFVNGTFSAAVKPTPSSYGYATAAVATFTAPAGAFSITAQYAGDGNYNPSPMSSMATPAAANAQIDYPPLPAAPVLANEYGPAARIAITGLASGASFQGFQLQWAPGIAPATGWSSSGITLAGEGKSPVAANGALGVWDTSSITQGGYYTIELLVNAGGVTTAAVTLVHLDPALISDNWPRWLEQRPAASGGMVPRTDVSGNSSLSLLLPAEGLDPFYGGTIQLFSVPGVFEKSLPLAGGGSSAFAPASGQFYPTMGGEQLVLTNGLQGLTGSIFELAVVGTDGSLIESEFPYNLSGAQLELEDVDGDGQLEAVTAGVKPSSNVTSGGTWSETDEVGVFRADGEQAGANLPIEIENGNRLLTWIESQQVLASDIDGDGQKELLVVEGDGPSSFTLLLFNADGSPRAWSTPDMGCYPVQISLADLDHNGQLEIIVLAATCEINGNNVSEGEPILHVLQPDGSERAGWPRPGGYSASFAVGDLNRDGNEEIVVPSASQILVFNADGTTFPGGWQLPQPGDGYGPVVLADIDGDGYPEVLTVESSVASVPATLAKPGAPPLNPQPTSSPAWTINQKSSPSPASVVREVNADGTISNRVEITPLDGSGFNLSCVATLFAFRRDGTIERSWDLLGATGNQPFPNSAQITVGDFDHQGITEIAVDYGLIYGGGVSGWENQGVAEVFTTGAASNPAVNDWPMTYQNVRNTSVLPHRGLVFSTPALGFGIQAGAASLPVQTVTLSNTNIMPLPIGGFNVNGDFSQANDCPATLAGGASCTVTVTFAPAAAGVRSGALTVSGGTTGTTPLVNLSGVGPGPLAAVNPTALTFAVQPVETSSAPQAVVVTNLTSTPFAVSPAITQAGVFPQYQDFVQTNNCGELLAGNASCTIYVTFRPQALIGAADNRTAALYVNSYNLVLAGPITLSGTAIWPAATLSPTALEFGNQQVNIASPSQSVTVTNTGTAPVTFFQICTSAANSEVCGTGDFSQTNNCGTTLPVGAACTFNVVFTPSAMGDRTGILSVDANASAALEVILDGTGTLPMGTVQPASLTFASQPVGATSKSQKLTLANGGNQALSITGVSATGDFSATSGCGAPLPPGGKCGITVIFAPKAAGTRNGTLSVASNSVPPIAAVSLSGTAIAPAPQLSSTSLDFGGQQVDSTSAARSVTLKNLGTASLPIYGISVTGNFRQSSHCRAALAVNASCTISVTFKPVASGARTGTLTVKSSASSPAPSLSLTGTGLAAVANIAPLSLSFAAQTVKSPSAAQPVTLSNKGNAPLNVSSIQISGTFGQSNNCGASVLSGQSCTINVTFTPTSVGKHVGTLTIRDSAFGSPAQKVSLTGVGVAPH